MIDRIAVNPKIHFGKPCIAGTRITVQSVLELLDEGLTFILYETFGSFLDWRKGDANES